MVQEASDLKGKTVAITRPVGQAEEAGKIIKERGGVPYYIPAIKIKGLNNFEPVKKFIFDLQKGQINYVILMSTNGVKYLFNAGRKLKLTVQLKRGLLKASVIAIGPQTAKALEEYGVRVDLVPVKYSSEGLIECLKEKDISGKTIRMPRTSNAAPTLTEKLREMGANVEEIYVYESALPLDEKMKKKFYVDLTNGKIDAIVFGSGLSAKNIFKILSEKASLERLRKIIQEKVTTVAIGPTTAEALKLMDIRVDVVPEDYLFEKALSALAQYWSTK